METDDPIPLFLSNPIEVPEQAGSLQPGKRAVTASRILTTGIWFVAAAAIVFAVLSVRNPLALFENATASLFATSVPQDGTGQSMPIIQSTADTQPLPPTASDAPTDDEIATNLKTADQSQTDISQPSAEALLNQFQARAEDAPAQVRPLQPLQDPQAQVVQTARAKSKDREKCTSTGPAGAECAGTEVEARAKHRSAQLDLAGSDAVPCQARGIRSAGSDLSRGRAGGRPAD